MVSYIRPLATAKSDSARFTPCALPRFNYMNSQAGTLAE